MSGVLAAIAPIFALILAGHGLRRLNFPGQDFWPDMERLTYYVLFPALLVDSLSGKDTGGLPVALPALALVLAVCATALLLVLLRPRLGLSGPAFTSILQGAIRPNTYVGLSLASALLGERGLAHSAVILLVLVPLVNILSVAALNRHGEGRARTGPLGVLRELARNPLILACLAGVALNAVGQRLPFGLSDILTILGRGALPLGLLAVGAGLRFQGARPWPLGLACLLHLALLPLLAAGACALLGAAPESRLVVVIFTAVPAAASSYILARQMGGDADLMAAVITAETAASALTLPLAVAWLG
ncbi:AEC family transporter [Desulfovibrio sp.]